MSQSLPESWQSPNGLVLCKSYIPEELVANILSFVEPRALVECRRVCKFWKSLIDEQVWRLKVVREHCRNLSDTIRINTSTTSWHDLYKICKKTPLGRNLIKNNCGQRGVLRHWTVLSNGGNRWAVEKTPVGADPLPVAANLGRTSCFATSYHSCSKKQTINLASQGLTAGFMDIVQPTIRVSEWFAARFDCGSIYEMCVTLTGENGETIQESPHRETVEQWQGGSWRQVSHEFRDYGPGVRHIEFYHGGQDTQFWAGHFGSKMTGASVVVDW